MGGGGYLREVGGGAISGKVGGGGEEGSWRDRGRTDRVWLGGGHGGREFINLFPCKMFTLHS